MTDSKKKSQFELNLQNFYLIECANDLLIIEKDSSSTPQKSIPPPLQDYINPNPQNATQTNQLKQEKSSYEKIILILTKTLPQPSKTIIRYLKTLLPLTKDSVITHIKDTKNALRIPDFKQYDISFFKVSDNSWIIRTYPPKKEPLQTAYPLQEKLSANKLRIIYIMPHRSLTGGMKMLFEQVKTLQKRGHEITLMIKGNHPRVTPDWVVDFTPTSEIVIPEGSYYLDNIDSQNYDIIYAGWYPQLNELENAEIPVFYWEQGHEWLYGDLKLAKQESYYRQFQQNSYQKNAYLASDSEYVRSIIKNRFQKDTHVLPIFIDTTFWKPTTEKKEKDQLTILLIGPPSLAFKGFDKSLDVLTTAWNKGYRFKVKWACQYIDKTPETPFEIEYHIHLPQPKLAELYRQSDILLTCSWYEGCPMPPLEAMASGCVVVATNSGGIKQYAIHEQNALISKDNQTETITNELTRALTQKELRQHLIENGLKTAKSMSCENSVATLELLLHSAIVDFKQKSENKTTGEKKLNILFVIGTLLGGGAERVLVDTIKNLDKSKFKPTVLLVHEWGLAHYIEEIKKHAHLHYIFRKNYYSEDDLEHINQTYELLKKHKNDETTFSKIAYEQALGNKKYEIEIAFLEDESTSIVANSPNSNSRKIAWIHADFMVHSGSDQFYRDLKHKQNTYQKFDDIVHVSHGVKQSFIEKTGITTNHHVIPNPIDIQNILTKAEKMPKDLPEKRKLTVISSGRLVDLKGFDRLIKAHHLLCQKGYDFDLWILGEGEKRPQLEAMITEYGLTDAVKLLGFKDNPYAYMKQADLFVCSSITEGFGMVITESLLLEIPVLSTLCTGVVEQLGKNEYGLIVDNTLEGISSGLEQFLTDATLLNNYKQKAVEKKEILMQTDQIKQVEALLLEKNNTRKNKITVFTPTYNRAHTLERLFESLKNQCYNHFEWIVVDDGSTDNTPELIEQFKKEKVSFDIIHLSIKNGGKHRAINKGVQLASGSLFFIVDSDDYIISTALKKINQWENSITDEQEKFAGISGNKGSDEITLIGETFDAEYIDATSLEREKFNITGDKSEVFYTHILRKFPFPEFEGEKFVTEATVWYAIAEAGFKIRWFNEIIYICDYLEDGLSRNLHKIPAPLGWANYWKIHNRAFSTYYVKEAAQILTQLQEIGKTIDTTLFNQMSITNKQSAAAIYDFIYKNQWPTTQYGLLKFAAQIAEKAGKIDISYRCLEMAADEYPHLRLPLLEIAEIAYVQKDFDKVYEYAKKALAITQKPESSFDNSAWESPTLNDYLFIATAEKMKILIEEAFDQAQICQKADPDNRRFLHNLNWANHMNSAYTAKLDSTPK